MIPNSLKHQIRSGFALAVLIMGLMGALAYSSTTTQIASGRWVAHTHHVLETLAGLLSDIEAAETAQRGYLLTGDVSHLEAYTAATQASDAQLEELRQLTVDNAAQQQRLVTLAPLLTAKIDDLAAKTDIAQTAGFDAAREAVRAGQGKLLMDRVTAVIHEMDGEERRLLESRAVLAEVDAGRTKLVIVVVSGFALLFLAGASVVIDRNLTQRQQVELALQQAKAEAEAANRSKSEFLSRMSHELRTPMNAILGFAQVLEMGQLEPEDRDSVAHILKGGRHLLVLINEVLDIARIEAGRLPISIEPVAVAEVCQEALDLIGPLAAVRHIQIRSTCDGADDQHVLADRQRIKQVLLNLLSNAVKYNHEGGSVTLACEVHPPDHSRIVVRDTGYGLTEAECARLFTPFERLHADEHGVEGTGLGLALSKRLVEAMAGSIGVKSTPGQGSTFWIDLPTAMHMSAEVTHAGELLATAEPGASLWRIRTILYIEDNLSNVKLVERILAVQPNVRLLTAMQGRMGLDLAREHRPDLIVLDLHLSDLSGLEVLRHLKGDERTAPIPVVMLSADAMAHQVDRFLAAGAIAYLTKPLDVREFVAVIVTALQGGNP